MVGDAARERRCWGGGEREKGKGVEEKRESE
jgi:hypothetical protein